MSVDLNKTSNIQHIVEISNDLSKLVPVGTLIFFNLPLHKSDLGGLPIHHHESVSDSQWKWLDINFLMYVCNGELNPILFDLQLVINFRYAMATYKTFTVKYRNEVLVMYKVRIYGLPTDVDGSRFFHEWRNSKPKNLHIEKRFKKSWCYLIKHMDYSDSGWAAGDAEIDFEKFVKQHHLLIDARAFKTLNRPEPSTSKLNFHVHRWTCNEKYSEEPKDDSEVKIPSLATRVHEIYDQITSPSLEKYKGKHLAKNRKDYVPNSEDVLIRLTASIPTNSEKVIEGVKTSLYPFQIRSIAKMFEKESFVEKSLSPNFVKLRGPGRNSYLDIMTYALHIKPEIFTLPRGGILAENMGLGKTLICLSLICLTKNDSSQVPDDLLLRGPKEEPELQELELDEENILRPLNAPPPQKVMSLVNICKECVNQNSLPWRYYASDLPPSVVSILLQDPGYFQIPLVNKEYESPFVLRTRKRSTRRSKAAAEEDEQSFRTLYLCNTTIIIVPDNLFHQWNTELNKHISSNYLSKLFISNQFRKNVDTKRGTYTNTIPRDPKELIKFDLIIVTHSYLARQVGDMSSEENPLNRVYWKRLIIDEGHSMNSKSSKTSILCKTIHAERRWAVTGTPTSGLTSLYMDEEQNDINVSIRSPKKSKYVVKSSFNEREDLVKLGTIIGNFLKIEPFLSRPKLWSQTIIQPLASNIYGSDVSLANLLNSIVVRHNSIDIEDDLKLPQLHHEAVFLEPSFHNKISINLFTAVLAVNAVSSERTDIDYMFHPANRQQLRRLITNLQRATFHWTGFKQDDVETLIHICNISLKKKNRDGSSVYSTNDLNLIKTSIEASKIALSNARWRTSALLHEMNYFVEGLPDAFTKYFGTGIVDNLVNGQHLEMAVFGAPHLNAIQEFYYKNRFLSMDNEEVLKERLEKVSKPFWQTYWKDSVRRNNERFNKHDADQVFESNLKNGAISNAINVPNIVKDFTRIRRRSSNTKKRHNSSPKDQLTEDGVDGLVITKEVNSKFSAVIEDLNDSVRKARILGTASAKLSYLGSRLMEHQRDKVKSLIFFEFEDSAYYLTELLDVLGVNYILYATFINPSQRARNLSLFSEYDSELQGGVTLIMDLRLAAHGLTIIAATRVYFISPVWQRSIEAQAIKRAHRIGQTQDVHVETLVLRGTLEEEIYRRRTQEAQNKDEDEEEESSKRRYVIDDTGMQQYILKHKFLAHDIRETEYAPFKAPALSEATNLNQENDSEYSLLNHSDTLVESPDYGKVRNWKVYLFTNDNLSKFNKTKGEKAQKEQIEAAYIDHFVDPESAPPIEATRKKRFKLHSRIRDSVPPPKKVRF
ncbi:DNA-dependent ATPase of the nucleotide excision repair factor 4 complex [Scheffersomyces xylosifermentans]|uniref:DNA-dependent ATPase of the nucleotide excision repair factor 4 complex n=1 Tax=Scheffersomyces xylosifermentans TaxID=1304137 RepID=UPI00315D7C4B